jgi:serine/threonine-protein kinase
VTLVVSAGPGTAEIPDLTGKPRSQALKALRGLGFKVTEQRTTDDTITENHVIETRPDAGEQREKGSTVVLVVSSGRERVTVPKVTGLSEDDARSTLQSLGFQIATTEQESEDQDPGTVLAQNPAPGTTLPKGARVTLTVAKEPQPVDVPDVVGEGRNAATHALKKAGFDVNVVEQPTDNLDEDRHVLEQEPATGQAKKGSTVTITVAKFDPSLNPDPGEGGTDTSTTAPSTTTTP